MALSIESLRAVPLLQVFDDDELTLLARTAEERHYPAGTSIVRQGEPGTSAFIMVEGLAETYLERPSGEPLTLSTIGPGELFGELALINEQNRSASVTAIEECLVIELSRDLFLREIATHPKVSLKLLWAVSQRLRRSEGIVGNFADRIYGDVLPRVDTAINAQLESAKTIYEQSKEQTNAAIKEAHGVLEKAEARWSGITRTLSLGATAATLVLGTAAYLGYEKFQDVAKGIENKYQDFEQFISDKRADVAKFVADIEQERRYLAVLKETTLVFDRLRRDLRVDGSGDLPPLPADRMRAARDFRVAYRNLMRDYIAQPERLKESEIVIDALDLVNGLTERHYILMDAEDWDHVTDSIVHAMRNPPAHWRDQQRLDDLIESLYAKMLHGHSEEANALVDHLEGMLKDDTLAQGSDVTKRTALVLTRLNSRDRRVKAVLDALQATESPWMRSEAAVALILWGDDRGWDTLRKDLAAPAPVETALFADHDQGQPRVSKAAYVAALRLAEIATDPPRKSAHQRRVGLDAMNAQLSRARLSKPGAPWPQDEPDGVALIGKTIATYLMSDPGKWGRFDWQTSCELVCTLDCDVNGLPTAGAFCQTCFDQLADHFYPPDSAPDRSAAICAASSSMLSDG